MYPSDIWYLPIVSSLSTSSGIDGNHRLVSEQFRTRRRLYITLLEDLALQSLNASARWQSPYHPPTGQLTWLWPHEKVGLDWGLYDLPWELQPRVFTLADCHVDLFLAFPHSYFSYLKGTSNQLVSGFPQLQHHRSLLLLLFSGMYF